MTLHKRGQMWAEPSGMTQWSTPHHAPTGCSHGVERERERERERGRGRGRGGGNGDSPLYIAWMFRDNGNKLCMKITRAKDNELIVQKTVQFYHHYIFCRAITYTPRKYNSNLQKTSPKIIIIQNSDSLYVYRAAGISHMKRCSKWNTCIYITMRKYTYRYALYYNTHTHTHKGYYSTCIQTNVCV